MKIVLAALTLAFGFVAHAKTSPVAVDCTLTKLSNEVNVVFDIKTNATKDVLSEAIYSEGTEPYPTPMKIVSTRTTPAGVQIEATGEDREVVLTVDARPVSKGVYKATMELKIHTTDRSGMDVTREVEAKDMTCGQI